MSIIAGIMNHTNYPVSEVDITKIMHSFQQFPADQVNVLKKDNIFLGCHAQWITPEAQFEQLPYFDNECQLGITADAIIDNREELFEKLNIDRPNRSISTDSELILKAYLKWGEDCPKHLIGDFAFMIWDKKHQKLFGARDFSGARTLYYYVEHNRFIFSSTLSGILALSHAKNEVNEDWLAQFLAIQGMIDSVDVSSTVYKNIQQIPPGHSITFQSQQVSQKRYFIGINKNTLRLKNTEEYAAAFQDVFQQAVNSRIRTNYDVGSQLSGGLDSGLVTAFAAKKLQEKDRRLYTFSYVPEQDFHDWTPRHRMANELPLINATVNHVGNIHSNTLEFAGKSSFTEIDSLLGILEMPFKFFENSFWVKGIYEKASQQNIRVLLNGARGNFSVSWGPALAYYAILLKRFKLLRLLKEVELYANNTGIPHSKKIYKVVFKKAFPNFQKQSGESDYKYPSIINEAFAQKMNVYDQVKSLNHNDFLNRPEEIFELRRKHFEDLFTWNSTGTTAAKFSHHYSIWKRDPTNDYRVIQFCLSVPIEQYVHKGIDRALIRNASKGFLPEQIRLNQKVRGIQGADWLKRIMPHQEVLLEELQHMITKPYVQEYLNVDTLQSAIPKLKNNFKPELAFDPDIRVLMRSLIVYRFLKNHIEGG